jgi:hypothetical protein
MANAPKPAVPNPKTHMARRALFSTAACKAGLSYATDIRPLFNTQEIKCMITNGPFDLSKYADVKANATAIYNAVNSGSMPLGLPAWTDDMVNTFQCWMQQGCQP